MSVGDLVDRLSIINIRIFMLEADIRLGVDLGEAEVGRRALQIRDLNAERVALKNSLTEALEPGPAFTDVKVNHRSAR